ncbi:MAG: hypothetical protein QW757_05815 [Candidatus Woesearchaeota archaeon]
MKNIVKIFIISLLIFSFLWSCTKQESIEKNKENLVQDELKNDKEDNNQYQQDFPNELLDEQLIEENSDVEIGEMI